MSELIATGEQNARLIRNGQLQADVWRVHAPASTEGSEAAPGDDTPPADEPGWIVGLATWIAHRDTLRARRHPVAVLLAPDAKLQEFMGPDGHLDPTGIAFIAIDFPIYTDGRGYSLAQLLRTRYGWQGELRAVGDVMIDTIHYQARVGFDSFLVKPGHDPHKALAALQTFTVHYQQTYPKPSLPAAA
jgi:uncharacterized protein (DUF934 family)